MIERETHFNAMNPFWQAPIAYGTALILLAVSLGFTAGRKSFTGLLGQGFYPIGMVALATGIALEIYGFALRVQISGWAPVTNMYETVIWVALVAAVLSLIFELIFRRTYSALAGSGVALLGTITAVNVPLLDPSIKSLQPVLRSNYWLTIHVLTEVSSYAAFGVAWARANRNGLLSDSDLSPLPSPCGAGPSPGARDPSASHGWCRRRGLLWCFRHAMGHRRRALLPIRDHGRDRRNDLAGRDPGHGG